MDEYCKPKTYCKNVCKLEGMNVQDETQEAECYKYIQEEVDYDEDCCTEDEIECPILKDPNFNKLINELLDLLKIVYIIRYITSKKKKITNKYDEFLIPKIISTIEFPYNNIELKDLECIKFPGGEQTGYPSNFGIYIRLMKAQSQPKTPGSNIKDNYLNFMSDFQPWLRTLSTFLNQHLDIEIPSPDKLDTYIPNFITQTDINVGIKYINFDELDRIMNLSLYGGRITKSKKFKSKKFKSKKFKSIKSKKIKLKQN